eukprot:PITA_24576
MVNTTQNPVVVPADPVQLAEFNKKNAKTKRLILEGIKDHDILHVRGNTYAHEMWTALTSLYQSSNENRKMVLKEKLKAIKMAKADSATTYVTRITSVRDELAAVGEIIAPTELNEIRKNHLGAAKQVEEDDNVALLATGKKGRAKKKKLPTMEAKAKTKVQREFAFPATSRASSSIWYVDSGASCHMIGVREYFSKLSKVDTDMEVVLGDDNIVRAVGVGTLTFDRGPKPPLKVSDVLYVAGMKKNLISSQHLRTKGMMCCLGEGRCLYILGELQLL